MDGAPAGVGGQNLGEEVAGRNDLSQEVGTQPPFKELVEPDEIEMELQCCVRDQSVGAVTDFITASKVDEAKKGGNNEDLTVAAHGQDPLQARNRRRHGDLMGHDKLSHQVIFFVF